MLVVNDLNLHRVVLRKVMSICGWTFYLRRKLSLKACLVLGLRIGDLVLEVGMHRVGHGH